jgi:hypothetical protein
MAGGAGGRPTGAPSTGAMSQLNGKTLADMPQASDPTLYQRALNQGRDPAEMAATRASWMDGALGISGQQAAAQAQPMTISQTLAQMTQGMPQSAPQAAAQPQSVQAPAGMPIFNTAQQPAISPQQQYMQRMGINRMGFNPQAYRNQAYAAPRPVPQFQPQLRPQQAQQSAQPQQTELDKLRAELEQLRNAQSSYGGSGGNG